MFHTTAFYVMSLVLWLILAYIWTHKEWYNLAFKVCFSLMAVWSLILVLQVFVPQR